MTKYKKAKIQSIDYSTLKLEGLFSFDREVIEEPTKPLLHQAARFLFIIDGKGVIRVNGDKCELKKGSLLAMMPWHFSEVTKVDKTLRYYILKYNVDMINRVVKLLRNLEDDNSFLELLYSNHVVQCDDLEMELLLEIFLTLKRELGEDSVFTHTQKQEFTEMYVISKIIEVITIFIRKVNSSEAITRAAAEEKDERYELVNVFKYLYSHLGKNLNLDHVANVFFISKSTLTRYIKNTTGMSFENLINEMKIGKTLEMLLYTELSINEISSILGYVDQSHLTKVFHHRVGKSPNKYRQIFGSSLILFNENDNRLFYKILDYVYKNYTNEITIDGISAKFGLTNAQLNEMFVYHIEKTFLNFVNFIRINSACALLLDTDKKVTDIALEVGYNNPKTFLRNFTKLRGMSPTEFKLNGKLQRFDL